MERQVQFRSKIPHKFKICVGFIPAQSVVEMGDMQDEAQFPAPLIECAQKRHGVGPAGDTDRETQAGAQECDVDWKRGAHMEMIEK